MNKIVGSLVLLVVLITPALSQDVHFSFPEYSPLLINPALAGANQAMEGVINYRNQWNALGQPYKTMAAGFHSRVTGKKRKQTNNQALGLQVMNDKAGLPGITSTSFSFVVADHVIISRESKIGVGINLGFIQRSIDQNSGQWGSQYDGTIYNPALPNGELFANPRIGIFDLGAGIVYTYQHRQSTLAKSIDQFLSVGISAQQSNSIHTNKKKRLLKALEEFRLS